MRLAFVSLLAAFLVVASGCGSPSTDDWLAALKDPSVVKRREALRALADRSTDAERVVPALVAALRDASSYVRHDAAWALGNYGMDAREAVPALASSLADETRLVKMAAATALKKIDPVAARTAGVK